MKKERLPHGDAEERMELDNVQNQQALAWCETNVRGPLPAPTAVTLALALSAPPTLGGPRLWVLLLFWTQMLCVATPLLTPTRSASVHMAECMLSFSCFLVEVK